MKDTIVVRNAQQEDLSSLSLLMNELGYPTSVDEMGLRFRQINEHPDFRTLIAECNGSIMGFVGFSVTYSYESEKKYIRILAFIVDEQFRGRKIGLELLKSVENFAEESGIRKIVLTCGNRDERITAHGFYKKAGFKVQSTGYIKILGQEPDE